MTRRKVSIISGGTQAVFSKPPGVFVQATVIDLRSPATYVPPSSNPSPLYVSETQIELPFTPAHGVTVEITVDERP